MKRILFATLLVGCSTNADIGINSQPVTCKPAADGAASGTILNPQTRKTYAFGATQVSLTTVDPTTGMTVALDDSTLALQLMFLCGQPQLGTFDIANSNPGGRAICPFALSGMVSGHLQEVYASAHTGTLIVDQNVGCIAGRYDLAFGLANGNGTYVDQGSVAGWFSVPLQ